MGVEAWMGAFKTMLKGTFMFGNTSCASCHSTRPAIIRHFFRLNYRKFRLWMSKPSVQRALTNVNEKMDVMGEAFALNCNAVLIQRIRRSVQIMTLYSRIYNECAVRYFISRFGQRIMLNAKGRRVPLILGATLFSWANERVTDEEMQDCVDDVLPSDGEEVELDHVPALSLVDCVNQHLCADGWEKIIDRDNLQTWRKPLSHAPHLYEYKVCGTFYDIPARAFFAVQLDLNYRKKWDRLVISLDAVDRDTELENSEVVRWVTHYPYPMYSREYVYVRRHHVDAENNVMVLVSRAVDHPQFPVTDKYVRVHTYNSTMVIKPHGSFDENGLDYVLTYHDDPQAAFPTLAYNWMASTGVPDFVEKLHRAAQNLVIKGRRPRHVVPDQSSESVACYS